MKKWLKYTLIVLLIVAGVTLFYFKAYIAKTTFKTTTPEYGKVESTVFGIGEVGAKDIYSINAQLGGKILTLHTDQGQWVKKGELLATIDPVDLPLLHEEAKIAHLKTIQESTALQKELENLHAQKELANNGPSAERCRSRPLHRTGLRPRAGCKRPQCAYRLLNHPSCS